MLRGRAARASLKRICHVCGQNVAFYYREDGSPISAARLETHTANGAICQGSKQISKNRISRGRLIEIL